MSRWLSSTSSKIAETIWPWSTVKKDVAADEPVRSDSDQSQAVPDKPVRGGSDQARTVSNTDTDTDTDKWNRVAVRLDLNIVTNGELQLEYGTGFFLNVPGATQDVIVTAGHNLIKPAKDAQSQPELTSNIDVQITSEEGKIITETVTPDRYHICTKYKEQLSATADPADDYGVILLDRPIVSGVPKPRDAFGYNIVLAAMDLSTPEPGTVLAGQVGGYPGNKQGAPTDRPKFSFAPAGFGKHADRQLDYHAGTDQGMSGGPVWVRFLGDDIAVGIQ